jgi:hypothetical protein
MDILLKGLTIGLSIAAPVGPIGLLASDVPLPMGRAQASSAVWVPQRRMPSMRSSADLR